MQVYRGIGLIDELNHDDVCMVDSATTHKILTNKKNFHCLKLSNANVNTILDLSNLIEGSGRAYIMLPKGTTFCINDALFLAKTRRNLLSFKEICHNGYHIETIDEGNKELLLITQMNSS